MLEIKGFPDKMVWLGYDDHEGGNVWVRVNDKIGLDFKTYKGPRQGDALSPLLFDLAADVLAVIMNKANVNGFIKGVLNEDLNHGVDMLQYVDDTIFLMQDDVDSAKNLKFILSAFEQMSRLKIIFIKVNYSCLVRLKI